MPSAEHLRFVNFKIKIEAVCMYKLFPVDCFGFINVDFLFLQGVYFQFDGIINYEDIYSRLMGQTSKRVNSCEIPLNIKNSNLISFKKIYKQFNIIILYYFIMLLLCYIIIYILHLYYIIYIISRVVT